MLLAAERQVHKHLVQPLREKFDSPRVGTLKCVQSMRTFSKKKFSILGKSDPVGRPETRNFLVRPKVFLNVA